MLALNFLSNGTIIVIFDKKSKHEKNYTFGFTC